MSAVMGSGAGVAPSPPQRVRHVTRPDPSLPWPLPFEDGVMPLATDEGCRLKAYKNFQREPWTCGWGETEGVTSTTVWTQEYADQRFCDSMTERVNAVKEACTVQPSPNQLAALTRFAYNYGKWRTSTVLRCHNRGDFIAAANAFALVNKVQDKDGKLIPNEGLTARRASESAQYLKPTEGRTRMPQAVAEESSMAKSPTNVTSLAGAAVGGLAAIGNVDTSAPAKSTVTSDVVSFAKGAIEPINTAVVGIKTFAVDTIGFPADWFLPLVLIGGSGFIWWRRRKQRNEGRA